MLIWDVLCVMKCPTTLVATAHVTCHEVTNCMDELTSIYIHDIYCTQHKWNVLIQRCYYQVAPKTDISGVYGNLSSLLDFKCYCICRLKHHLNMISVHLVMHQLYGSDNQCINTSRCGCLQVTLMSWQMEMLNFIYMCRIPEPSICCIVPGANCYTCNKIIIL